jgi:hypothetical protein
MHEYQKIADGEKRRKLEQRQYLGVDNLLQKHSL